MITKASLIRRPGQPGLPTFCLSGTDGIIQKVGRRRQKEKLNFNGQQTNHY